MKLLFSLSLLCAVAYAQAPVRVDPAGAYTTVGNTPIGNATPILGNPSASVILTTDALGTLPATTYATSSLSFPCPVNAQVTLPGSILCQSTTGALGQFGFWVQPGTYYYSLRLISGIRIPGTGSYPITVGSAGTVTTITGPNGITWTLSGGTYTATWNSQTANYFLAAPNGTAGAPIFRAILPADIPTLNQNTTGNAGTATALAATPTLCTGGQVAIGILANGNATGCTSAGGGGAFSTLSDTFPLTKTSSSQWTINASATTTTPVIGRAGPTSYKFTAPYTITTSGTSNTGTAGAICFSAAGGLYFTSNLSTTFTVSGISFVSGSQTCAAGDITEWVPTMTANVPDAITEGMDQRASQSFQPPPVQGTCITIGTSGNSPSIAFDTSGCPLGNGGLTSSGTAALPTGTLTAGSCAAVTTVAATGTTSTSAITWNPNASIKAVTGYGPGGGGLSIASYPTAGNVNFDQCNFSSSSITPGAVTLNWTSFGGGAVASGTLTLGTSLIASGACATVATAVATGAASTSKIAWSPNASIKAVTGYVPLTTGGLSIAVYPTSNTVNADVCNATASSITPGAVTLNWAVF